MDNLVVLEVDDKSTVIPAADRWLANRCPFTRRSSPAFFDSRLRKSAPGPVAAGTWLDAINHQFIACRGSGNEKTSKNCCRNSFSEHGIGTLHRARWQKYSISMRPEIWLTSRSRSLDSTSGMRTARIIMTNRPSGRPAAALLLRWLYFASLTFAASPAMPAMATP